MTNRRPAANETQGSEQRGEINCIVHKPRLSHAPLDLHLLLAPISRLPGAIHRLRSRALQYTCSICMQQAAPMQHTCMQQAAHMQHTSLRSTRVAYMQHACTQHTHATYMRHTCDIHAVYTHATGSICSMHAQHTCSIHAACMQHTCNIHATYMQHIDPSCCHSLQKPRASCLFSSVSDDDSSNKQS